MDPTPSGTCLVSVWLVNPSECRARHPGEEVINTHCLAEPLKAESCPTLQKPILHFLHSPRALDLHGCTPLMEDKHWDEMNLIFER